MQKTFICHCCKKEKPANPRLKGSQTYCKEISCQRERKRVWYKKKWIMILPTGSGKPNVSENGAGKSQSTNIKNTTAKPTRNTWSQIVSNKRNATVKAPGKL